MKPKFQVLVFIILFLISLNVSSCTDSRFMLSIWTSGRYELIVQNKTWLKSSPNVFLKANGKIYSTADESLLLETTTGGSGWDQLGLWQSTDFEYVPANNSETRMEASIINYMQYDIVRFRQKFPNGANWTGSTNYGSILSSFPSFMVESYDELELGYLSFGGLMAGNNDKIFGKWTGPRSSINDGMTAGPLVLFTTNGNTLIISQMSQFMDTSMEHNIVTGGYLNYGIKSGVNQIPANYSVDFIVYFSRQGINKAMEEWGQILLKYYSKDTTFRDKDFTANYLSYWTDNGAYYFWNTEPGKNYEDTIIDIFLNSSASKIPFRSIQYDSWWYGAGEGFRQGAFLWDGTYKTEKLPNSLTYLYQTLKLPVIAQNKFWDIEVYYARQNGGKYNFILDDVNRKSLPFDTQFWNNLFYNASTMWGLKTYEQDWLAQQTLSFTPMLTNLTLGRYWLMSMGSAADLNHMTILYSMSLSSHIMQSLEINRVTQARVSDDYANNFVYDAQQWRIGVSSLFVWALGLVPFKDVYWTTSTQPGNPYGPRAVDPNVELNSLIAVLTTGPVGTGDRIGEFMNRTLIMRSCNQEGLLLKPSKPITSIDAQMYAKAFGIAYGPDGEVWSTYSNISGLIYGILFAADMANTFDVTPSFVGFPVDSYSIAWKYESTYTSTFSESSPIKLTSLCSIQHFCLYYISPVFSINGHRVAVLGEKSKWVPVSPQRVQSISYNLTSLSVNVIGTNEEIIDFVFLIDSTPQTVRCFNQATNLFKIYLDFKDEISAQCLPTY